MAGSRVVRPSKEKFYVRVEAGEGAVQFFDATEHVGKNMPFQKPRATCAMRVSPDAVSFSLLHLTNKNSAQVAAKPVVIPRGPLSRLERRAVSYAPMDGTKLIVEFSSRPMNDAPESAPQESEKSAEGGLDDLFADAPKEAPGLDDLFGGTSIVDAAEGAGVGSEALSGEKKRRPMKPAVIEQFELSLVRDEHSVARLEAVGEEHTFELPKGAVHVSLYLASPVKSVNRTLAIGFIGHVGKPGTSETITRVAAMVLNSLSHLADFRILAGIETCVVPANPTRGERRPAVKQAAERVQFPVKCYLFDEQTQPVANGHVAVEIDLENANPATGKLMLNLTPDKATEAVFDRYRAVLERAVSNHLYALLGEDGVSSIVYDVVLGSVSASTVEELKGHGKNFPAFDLTPAQFREHV